VGGASHPDALIHPHSERAIIAVSCRSKAFPI
jgi:hypothetical protein